MYTPGIIDILTKSPGPSQISLLNAPPPRIQNMYPQGNHGHPTTPDSVSEPTPQWSVRIVKIFSIHWLTWITELTTVRKVLNERNTPSSGIEHSTFGSDGLIKPTCHLSWQSSWLITSFEPLVITIFPTMSHSFPQCSTILTQCPAMFPQCSTILTQCPAMSHNVFAMFYNTHTMSHITL